MPEAGRRTRNARTLAALAVNEVIGEGRSLSAVLPVWLESASSRDRGLVQELSYGVLRWYPRLDAMLGQLLQKPLKDKDRDLHALLLVGLYQLDCLSLAPHGVVHASVESTRELGKAWASKLVNAVLRNFQRRREAIEAALDGREESRYAHPSWLLDRLKQDWPARWEAIVDAGNRRPPMGLRVNVRHQGRDVYLQRLHEAGIAARAIEATEQGVVLETPVPVEQLPGFGEGDVSVQDGAAQRAVELLDAREGMRVLDACAAPGGKTGHILERTPGLAGVLALDRDPVRLERVRENLERLGLRAELMAADAAEPDSWWDGCAFDRILLDAPCSATGVIRRHPDIKWLRTARDIDALVEQQRRLLNALWPLLAPGGMLVYCTCSVLRAENTDQVAAFLRGRNDAREQTVAAAWGHAGEHGRQLLPGEQDLDGFYYASIRKPG